MLGIVTSYHNIQFHGKLMIQTQENGKKLRSGPDLGLLEPNSGRKSFFFLIWLPQSLDIKVSYQHAKYQKKLKIQS